jgi:hypothetical protein
MSSSDSTLWSDKEAYYREARQLGEPLRGLVFSMATAADTSDLRQTRQGRSLIRLLNHDRLMQWLSNADATVDLASVRQVYEQVEALLGADHHYWLQRGSLETERGGMDLAKNFLDQARSLAPDDPYVQSEWAYMSLKRAYTNATDPEAVTHANAALDTRCRPSSRPSGFLPVPHLRKPGACVGEAWSLGLG